MADILVVDDQRDVVDPLICFLELEGHTVRYAEDGSKGLAEISKKFPELIFLDIEMPQLTGPEMAYRLLIEDCGREEIPIFVLSGVSDLGSVVSEIGTPYYLPKPYSLDDIEQLLSLALRERKPPVPKRRPSRGVA